MMRSAVSNARSVVSLIAGRTTKKKMPATIRETMTPKMPPVRTRSMGMGLQRLLVWGASNEDDAMARLRPCHREQSLIVTLSVGSGWLVCGGAAEG